VTQHAEHKAVEKNRAAGAVRRGELCSVWAKLASLITWRDDQIARPIVRSQLLVNLHERGCNVL